MARPGLTGHRKFRRLSRALGSQIVARGSLELLWDSCYEAGDDMVGTAEDIEHAVGWTGEQGMLTQALAEAGAPIGAGFIERIEGPGEPVYRVHDLWHHAPEYVSNRRSREHERRQEKACARCGSTYYAADPRSLYCSPACKQGGWRDRRNGVLPTPSVTESRGAESGAVDREASGGDPADGQALSRDSSKPQSNVTEVRPKRDGNETDRYPTRTPSTQHAHPARKEKSGSPVPDGPVFLAFPCIGTGPDTWPLTESKVDEWRVAYPGLNIKAEMQQALVWCRANPGNRKTFGGMERFLVRWLNRSANDGRRHVTPDPARGSADRRLVGTGFNCGHQPPCRNEIACLARSKQARA